MRLLILAVSAGFMVFGGTSSLGSEQVESGAQILADYTQDLRALRSALSEIANAVTALKEDRATEQQDFEAAMSAADLEAQKEMARWAAPVAIAGGLGVLISLIGLGLIWGTLVHTRRAADYAKDMAIEAKRGTEAAMEAAAAAIGANEQSRRFGELEARAYLSIGDVTILTHEGEENLLTFAFTITNAGASPAFNISAVSFPFGSDSVSLGDRPKLVVPRGNTLPLAAMLPPGGKFDTSFSVWRTQCVDNDFAPTPLARILRAEAMITYQTLFDMERNSFSGELGVMVEVPDEAWEGMGRGEVFEGLSGLPAFRSSWMYQYLMRMNENCSRRLFKQFEDPSTV